MNFLVIASWVFLFAVMCIVIWIRQFVSLSYSSLLLLMHLIIMRVLMQIWCVWDLHVLLSVSRCSRELSDSCRHIHARVERLCSCKWAGIACDFACFRLHRVLDVMMAFEEVSREPLCASRLSGFTLDVSVPRSIYGPRESPKGSRREITASNVFDFPSRAEHHQHSH